MPGDLDKVLCAVTEIATNAIRHGGSAGSLTIVAGSGGLLVEMRDNGPGLPDGLATGCPATDAVGGRGLWLARRRCSDITIATGPDGVTAQIVAAAPVGPT